MDILIVSSDFICNRLFERKNYGEFEDVDRWALNQVWALLRGGLCVTAQVACP